ncbi:phage tail protein [Escherichia coli]|nr:phage tail protein [Escherichia coli]
MDQSKNEYHISLTGGTAPGTQLDRQLQDALEKYERINVRAPVPA